MIEITSRRRQKCRSRGGNIYTTFAQRYEGSLAGRTSRNQVFPNIKLVHQSKQTLKVRASDTKGNYAKWRTWLLFDPHQRAVMRNTPPTGTALEREFISSSGVISFAGDGALFAELNNEQPFTPALLFFFLFPSRSSSVCLRPSAAIKRFQKPGDQFIIMHPLNVLNALFTQTMNNLQAPGFR